MIKRTYCKVKINNNLLNQDISLPCISNDSFEIKLDPLTDEQQRSLNIFVKNAMRILESNPPSQPIHPL